MSSTHEIITIQAGHYANFVGTHWWNMQESSFTYDREKASTLDMNHDAQFREGVNLQGEVTFTPRLICLDLKGSLKNLPELGTLYGIPETKISPSTWDQSIEVVKEDSVPKNDFLADLGNKKLSMENVGQSTLTYKDKLSSAKSFYDLDNSVQVWSDFLKVSLHPKSICLINQYIHNDENNPFDVHECGTEVFQSEPTRNSVEDKLRFFVEECDYLQGFHILVDSYNGFSGIGDYVLQHLDEEYHNKTTLCFPIIQNSQQMLPFNEVQKEKIYRLYSILHSVHSSNNFSTIYSPLSLSNGIMAFDDTCPNFPFLRIKPKLHYHSSAVLAVAVEAITSPYRLKNRRFTMSDIAENITLYGRKLVATNVCLPVPIEEKSCFSVLTQHDKQPEALMYSLTPCCSLEYNSLVQSAVLRGIPKYKFYSAHTPSHCKVEVEELFGQFLSKYCPSSIMTASVIEEKCKVSSPFPNIFCPQINVNGLVGLVGRTNDAGVENIAVATSLCNSNGAYSLIDMLLQHANKAAFKLYAKNADRCLEGDDFQEILQSLNYLRECYGPEFSS